MMGLKGKAEQLRSFSLKTGEGTDNGNFPTVRRYYAEDGEQLFLTTFKNNTRKIYVKWQKWREGGASCLETDHGDGGKTCLGKHIDQPLGKTCNSSVSVCIESMM